VIVTGKQPPNLMFSIETLAQVYGVDLLGTLAKPVTPAKLQALLENYVPPRPRQAIETGPRLSFTDIGIGLQERQFEPFFQPKIELATGQVKGLEVFARWRHPEYGVLTPVSFIHALEENNRIDFLDWSMIEMSVERCRQFHDRGIPISISINLAAETIAHPAFIRQITACIGRHRLMPDYVTFEMPESSVLTSDPNFIERLVRLRMMGFGLAIDDYGTGRSNLQLLARVPFSELKIDRSFVDGASKKLALGTVLRSCLGLARNLDRMSVAVGVETRQDWDFLQGLGCTYAQGYHIANPMEASSFPGWLEDWRHFF
jgi:EAL domain-containing protein (putative c-di-GMP-specific phosphodiesterase class I)